MYIIIHGDIYMLLPGNAGATPGFLEVLTKLVDLL